MARVLFAPTAEADLAAIHEYIGTENHSPAAADRLIDRIYEKCRLYAGNPELGERRPDLGAGLRVLVVGKYVVIYTPAEDGIYVVRVLHGSRDYPSLFS